MCIWHFNDEADRKQESESRNQEKLERIKTAEVKEKVSALEKEKVEKERGNAFRSFDVDRRHWVKLLLRVTCMSIARTVLNRVALVDLDDNNTVNPHLLKEFNLTPRENRLKFIDAKKTAVQKPQWSKTPWRNESEISGKSETTMRGRGSDTNQIGKSQYEGVWIF